MAQPRNAVPWIRPGRRDDRRAAVAALSESTLAIYAITIAFSVVGCTGFVVVLAFLWTQSALLPAIFVTVYGLAAAIWVAVVVGYHARRSYRAR